MTPLDTVSRSKAETPIPQKRAPRKVRVLTTEDWWTLGGSLLSSLALVLVAYEHILDASGTVGFLFSWYVAFLLIYGCVVAISNPRNVVVDRLVTVTLYIAAGLVLFALGTTVVFTFGKGWHAFVHLNFFTHDMSGVSLTAPLNQGGILHAIVGSLIEVAIAVAVSLPLGIGTAVYMSEVGGRGSRSVRTVVEAMTALPEILAGLFVYVTLIVDFGLPKSGLAVSVAMAVTMVPIMARASEVALRVVPNGLREASSALGASHWKTVHKVVLPSARAGLATAAILGTARGIGETAIPLIVSGASSFMNFNPVVNPTNSLPLFVYTAYLTGEPPAVARAFGAASVLLAMVLALFVATRVISRNRGASR
ncbi:MAG: PstA family ABC transporter permease [Acidimicrobiales bacterium]